MKKTMEQMYKEWREEIEGLIADGELGSTDCGESCVREDFSNYAKLDKVIDFEEMLELERDYDRSH